VLRRGGNQACSSRLGITTAWPGVCLDINDEVDWIEVAF
jgi:hypothetical protein